MVKICIGGICDGGDGSSCLVDGVVIVVSSSS